MARRSKKSSPAEDFVEVIAMLPWWAGIAIAAAFYLWLHGVASPPLPAITGQPGQVGAIVGQTLTKDLAGLGQYFLPALCLVAAGVSAWRRRSRQNLLTDAAQSHAADALENISWSDFEVLVGEAYRMKGFQVIERGGSSADGGVDLVLRKENEKFFVQCKQWKAMRVGVDVVRQLYGVMAANGATGGFVVTSGRFTDAAAHFGKGRNIELVDGPQLHAMIHGAKNASASLRMDRPAVREQATPTCPACAGQMVRRTARRGSKHGQEFWGCITYPSCRVTRPLAA